jgi:hypothetical protein
MGADAMKQTQYERILAFLRKNKQATVRQLLQFTNYPSSRIHEMTNLWDDVRPEYGGKQAPGLYPTERITRHWTTTRDGKIVRLYRLERVR